MADVSAFGKPIPKASAASLLSSPSLNEMPSPTNPAKLPGNESAKHYAHVLFSLYALKKTEMDPMASRQIEDFLQFADQRYSELALADDELSELAPPVAPPPVMPAPVAPPAPTPTPDAPPQMPGIQIPGLG